MKQLLALLLCFFTLSAAAQTKISGTVLGPDEEPVQGATVNISNDIRATFTDTKGYFRFNLDVEKQLPFDIIINSVGYESQVIPITENNQVISITMKEQETKLQQIVVAASRTPEQIFESPVAIEQIDQEDIQQTSSASFYEGLENVKGVDLNNSSFTFKSVNTRGFATISNYRFVQLVDGMDNSSPALNFVVGNLLGMSELDVESMELLPGASSALYGANAFNGILFMNSKSPFDHQGVSAYAKGGALNQGGNYEGFGDVGFRVGHAFNNKFAAKASFSYLKGNEWPATNNNDFVTGVENRVNPGYDGLNVYGDEISTTINFDALAMTTPGRYGSSTISRTGYADNDINEYDAESFKADVALHFKPNADDLEFIYNGKFGKGNTIFQGVNRYSIKDFTLTQHKLEARADNFFVRGYFTAEDAGDSYDSRFTAININRAWKTDQRWFNDYGKAWVSAVGGDVPGVTPGNPATAHAYARETADTGRFLPGTEEFETAFNTITADPNLRTGSQFVDNSKLYHVDANYNFKNELDFAEVQVGGSWRQYGLDSGGTIFTDVDDKINYNEYGVYTQIQKLFAEEKVKFTGSLRYDKSQNFDGNISPRIAMAFFPDEEKRHNIRASFQTGFRNPTTQDQYIGLDTGRAILIGSAEDNLDRYLSRPIANSMAAQSLGFPETVQLSGRSAYENAFSLNSLMAFANSVNNGTPNPALLKQANSTLVKPEKVSAAEIGYRSDLGSSTFLDVSVYYNTYKDFISTETVVVPNYGNTDFSDINPDVMRPNAIIAVANGDWTAFQAYTNAAAEIESYGVTMGGERKFLEKYTAGLNYTFADFKVDEEENPDFRPGFNTPKHKVKASVIGREVLPNAGFAVNWRWNDNYFWQSGFVDGNVSARNVVDAQVNYRVENMKSTFKLGAVNLLNHNYESVPGSGMLGAQYFLSWTFGQ